MVFNQLCIKKVDTLKSQTGTDSHISQRLLLLFFTGINKHPEIRREIVTA